MIPIPGVHDGYEPHEPYKCRVKKYGAQVDRIMAAFGFGDTYWLVTDESMVGDFGLSEMDLAMATKSLDPDGSIGLDVCQDQHLADIAEKMACT